MRNYFLGVLLLGGLGLTAACTHEGLTGHGCDVAGAPASCGMTCVDDTSCGVGAYCAAAKTCTADCNASSAPCSDGKFCSPHGKCLDSPLVTDGGNPFDRDGACAVLSSAATLEKSPVDVILVIDNSGSMTNEIQSVQNNVNTNFATIIAASGLDYHVIVLAKHGSASADQSICIDAPLSGNASCTPPPAKPVNTTKFFQYSQEIGSHDSFTQILNTYNQPDPSGASATGWSAWLRPNAVKHFILITDDTYTKSGNGPNNEVDFDTRLLALTPSNFGTAAKRNYVFHSILGLKANTPVTTPWQPTDPIQTTKCVAPPADQAPPNQGEVYQRLSVLTSGLRYPICEYGNFDAVFKAVAAGVVASGAVACDFDIPAPANGGTINLDNIAVSYTPGSGGSAQFFKQSATSAACVANAFYVEAGRIHLCPSTCTAIKADPTAKVEVLFTCDSTIL